MARLNANGTADASFVLENIPTSRLISTATAKPTFRRFAHQTGAGIY
ncbi:MAG: hypothetical protein H0W45_12545 [Acidobacteria bacterium]|nr:hypothetical protein [Acidobacteriota bacterium]